MFFGHLAVEKILKSVYVAKKESNPPYIHNLERLAEISVINLTVEMKENLIRISRFNLEARYPDEKRTFRKKCTEEFANKELATVEEVYKWIKSILL
ncbi:MAG: HEPN domain-containing protein [Nitrospirae bacterium]|nr:HEPN domain-containing protein [Nitrospirota bacterium]